MKRLLLCLVFAGTGCQSEIAPKSEPPASPNKEHTGSQPASQPASASSQPSLTEVSARAEAGKKRLAETPAGQAVARAIEAHGGLEAWYKAGALSFNYDYQPVEGPRRKSDQVVDILRSRAYHDMTHPLKGTFAYDGKEAWMLFEGGSYPARFWALTPYYFVGMPFVLADPGVRLSLSKDDPVKAGLPKGTKVVRVEFAAGTGDAPDDYYVIYLEEKTSQLLALRYVVSYAPFMKPGMEHTPEKLLVYGDWTDAGGLRLAQKQEFFVFADGKKGKRVTLSTIADLKAGVAFDEARLARPEGAVIDDSLDKSKAH